MRTPLIRYSCAGQNVPGLFTESAPNAFAMVASGAGHVADSSQSKHLVPSVWLQQPPREAAARTSAIVVTWPDARAIASARSDGDLIVDELSHRPRSAHLTILMPVHGAAPPSGRGSPGQPRPPGNLSESPGDVGEAGHDEFARRDVAGEGCDLQNRVLDTHQALTTAPRRPGCLEREIRGKGRQGSSELGQRGIHS